jgi:hypothetical protein
VGYSSRAVVESSFALCAGKKDSTWNINRISRGKDDRRNVIENRDRPSNLVSQNNLLLLICIDRFYPCCNRNRGGEPEREWSIGLNIDNQLLAGKERQCYYVSA